MSYIYTYMALTSARARIWVKHFRKSPVLSSKMAMKHPPTYFHVSMFFLFLAFSVMAFLLPLCFLTLSSLSIAHPIRCLAFVLYICCEVIIWAKFWPFQGLFVFFCSFLCGLPGLFSYQLRPTYCCLPLTSSGHSENALKRDLLPPCCPLVLQLWVTR